MLGKLITAKALGLAGALALTGGVAAAATGTLPDPVQDTASHTAEHVGVHIPEGDHGAAVSGVAHDKAGDGDENHGARVSEIARQNHGHDTTTSTTVAGDDSSGPGNSRGHANDHATEDHGHDGVNDDDDATTSTTTVGNTTTTVHDDAGEHGADHANSGHSGGEPEPGHGHTGNN
jgi:hypothetical protein